MTKSVVTLLMALIGVIGAYFIYSQGNSIPELSLTPVDTKELDAQGEKKEPEATLSESEGTKSSENINYPSPVIELQQTLTHGIQHLDDPELPLVQGDLKDFSEHTMPQDIAMPDELIELNQELERLQAKVKKE
ncbi:hypothetical protein HC752_14000 [Vibrio sp. S9_S30]|uniref:hypothetical protein n=1 Tax=Vibrio sp. S9_S30 TaxID=2720226 RepID=UPI0016812096|nr:hypothetical protein [Vibrio sp. S9_S30]MBD1558048.1 hypothetical protein [Vibrio sp. S9_S30]